MVKNKKSQLLKRMGVCKKGGEPFPFSAQAQGSWLFSWHKTNRIRCATL